jgi:hypothetical protein
VTRTGTALDDPRISHAVETLWDHHNTGADPDGRALPRAKRHDDKTLVVWRS